ncbi:MAG: polyamine ABC transporter periplasmic-binding protein PotD [Nitrospira sp. OLB3]|nr:MAG: polyamine ABC transporter periplasmic-binding protein PotD [Nitrospira sp. OLB3]
MGSALRRNSPFVLLLVACFCGLAACGRAGEGASGEGRPVLHYFTWSDYVGPEIIREFERREQAKVVVDTFSSNEELLAKLQSGATGYDVAVPSDFMVAIMMQQGLLSELDRTQLPNAADLEPHLRAPHFDPEGQYSVPYLWGTVGIGYDSAVITTPPDSWSVLWDPRYRGRISMLNDQREVFGAVLRAMGRSMNSTDPKEIEAAKESLLRQKPLVKTYTSDHYDQLLASGEVILAHGWGGRWLGPWWNGRRCATSCQRKGRRFGPTAWWCSGRRPTRNSRCGSSTSSWIPRSRRARPSGSASPRPPAGPGSE